MVIENQGQALVMIFYTSESFGLINIIGILHTNSDVEAKF